ncbi:MAG: hypothetical protein Q4C53_03350 [Clostridia bacterium]|nr:hypothetical protein [Clostridia bacterium]
MEQRKKTKRIAFCGLITGFGVLIMLSGGLIPVLTYCAPLAAAALLLPVLIEYGKASALTVWLATGLVALAVGADKEAAFFYVFTGWYPVLKPRLDAIPRKSFRLLLKLAALTSGVAAMYSFLLLLLRPASVMADFSDMSRWMTVAFCGALSLILLVYDGVLLRLAYLYLKKLRPKLAHLI